MTAFIARADRRLIRATYQSHRFVLAEIEAPEARANATRPPVNLAFVLDRSGSMSNGKLELAKQAVEASIARLADGDRFCIVMYDDTVQVLMPSTRPSGSARAEALRLLSGVQPGGSTNLAEGWLRGCEQVAATLQAEGVNRALLLTDGLANVGITDPQALAAHAAELRARGVQTTTFGVGADFDEALLQGMAAAGGGHFYFLADAASIQDHVTSEVGEALDVVARDVRIEVSTPDGVTVECIGPNLVERRTGRWDVLVGDLTSGERASLVLRLRFPYGTPGEMTGVMLSVADRESVISAPAARLSWQYANDPANDVQDRDRDVDRAVARAFAARAKQEAVYYNRLRDFEAARKVLQATARRIAKYAGRDSELRAILADLQREAELFDRPMLEMERKQHYAQASYAMRSRDMQGRATKASGPRS